MEPTRVSEATQSKVDTEVSRLVDEGYRRALEILKKYKKKMDKLVDRLLIVETIEQEEFERIMGIKKVAYEENPVG